MSLHIKRVTRLATLLVIVATLLVTVWIVWQHFSVPETSRSQPSREPLVQINPRLVPPTALRAYRSAAEDHNVDWKLLAALGYAESNHGRSPLPGVRSGINSVGCCAGPMQLCVSDDCGNVASMYARDGDGNGKYSVYDIDDAAATAASYIDWMKSLVGSDPQKLAAAYNAGPTIVARQGIPDYPETKQYIRRVQKIMLRLEKSS